MLGCIIHEKLMQSLFSPFGQRSELRDDIFKHIAAYLGVGLGLFIGEEVHTVILIKLRKKINHCGDVGKYFGTGLKDTGKYVLIHMTDTGCFKIWFGMLDIILGREPADILRIHPAKLGFIEDRRRFA